MTERKVLVFRVGGQEFAADISSVREVIAAPSVSTLPQAKAPVTGVFNLRGNIVTAVDGARALGLDALELPASRAVVADVDGHLVGLLVSQASEVLTMDDADLRTTHATGESGARDIAEGVVLAGDRPIVLVNLSNVLAATRGADPTGLTEATQ